jgi:hypothetical protein
VPDSHREIEWVPYDRRARRRRLVGWIAAALVAAALVVTRLVMA